MVEINGLENPTEYHKNVTHSIERTVDWTTKGLKITRLRLVSDIGFPVWDVSYCHGFIGDEPVRVRLPFGHLPKKGMSTAIIEAAKKDGVYAKGLGVFDAISTIQ